MATGETPASHPPAARPGAIEVILLAAGASRRMRGANKLLLPAHGMPLIRASAAIYCELGMPLCVVLRAGAVDAAAVRAALAGLPLRIAVNPDPATEQGDSARIGLSAAALNGPGVMIALADQPLLTGPDIAALIAHFIAQKATRICVPRHGGVRGNPVILPTALARRLRDDPATPSPRRFIDAQAEAISWFEAPNDHFTRDIDTPQDAARLLTTSKHATDRAQPPGD